MITLKNVTKIFEDKGNERVTALRNVNLTFEEKGMVFVSGFSGAGKSTLLSIIGGLDVPSSGSVVVDNYSMKGNVCEDLDRYRNNYVGFVFENVNLINNMTVEENIKASCSFNGKEPSSNQMEFLLDKLKLNSIRKRKPNQISLGQRQRVGVARALIKDPYIYLADDPTGHVDATRAEEVWEILKEISKKRLVVAVCHDTRIINKYADRIITIDNGEIISDVEHKTGDAKSKNFVAKTISEINATKSAQEIITQKHKFSFKNMIKLAVNNLSYRKWRVSFVCLITTLALLFFSAFNIMNKFERVEVLAKSVVQNKMDYVTFIKNDGSNVENAEYNEIVNYYINETSYSTNFKANKLIKYENAWYSTPGSTKTFNISYVVKQANTAGNLTSLGAKLLFTEDTISEDKRSHKPTNELEWVISDYAANQIQTALKLDSIQDVIGRELNITAKSIYNPSVKVVGIFETDYKKYVDPETLLSNGYKPYEFEYNLEYVYSIAMVHEDYLSRLVEENTQRARFLVQGSHVQLGVSIASSGYMGVSKVTSSVANGVWIDGLTEKTNKWVLEENGVTGYTLGYDKEGYAQIIVPMSFFNQLFGTNGFKSSMGNGISTSYLNDNGYSFSNIIKERTQPFVTISFDGKKEKVYEIRGITETDEFIVPDEEFENIFTGLNLSTVGMIVKAPSSQDLMENVIETLEDKGFAFTSTTSSKINEFNNNINVFRIVFLIGSIFFAFFTVILLYFFVYSLISDRKREIGVFRSFGARGRDILAIFLFSGLIIMLAVLVLTTIGTLTVTTLGNIYAQSVLGSVFNVFNAGVIDFVIIAILCAVTIVLGTSLPIYNYVKHGPYEMVNGFNG